jgi:hypothetical protein
VSHLSARVGSGGVVFQIRISNPLEGMRSYTGVPRIVFLVLARVTRRFETRVRDWEANIALIAPQTSDAISIPMVVTSERAFPA